MTSAARAGEPAGRFLETAHGRIFCMHFPARARASSGALVIAPPFAEEMNKCRRMWSLLATQLGAAGIATFIPDLHGTGESDGDFADARWDHWREDLRAACRYARDAGAQRIVLLGVRLGALLALDLARSEPGVAQRLVFWQPVASGQQHLNQFLRLKLAAGLRQAAATKETTTTLRERLARGERLEVAGYELSQPLVAAIDALEATVLTAPGAPRIDWLEASTADPPALLPASERTLEKLRATGAEVHARAVKGEAFWALQEITVAPEMNAATIELAREAV
jgi:exosortase A-associated hydrolase 2